ncbi:MAG: serine/threonine protein kinase [Candidatus Xenobia bacterium]
MLQPGEVLDHRYQIIRCLGKGGVGAVWHAEDTTTGREVVIKEIAYSRDARANWGFAMQSLRAEVALLTVLHHPSLVRVRDYFDALGQQFLVMDFAPGRSLERIIQDNLKYGQTVHPANVACWADQICAVLHYLHSQDPPIIYCDLKPSNVMIDDDLRVRLVDFGASFNLEAAPNGRKEQVSGGTPCFAPVEQYEGTVVDGRADIYALGACLYCLLCRSLPPPADALAAGTPLPMPSQFGVHAAWDALLSTMLAVRKEKRYRTVQRAWQEMHAIFRQQGLDYSRTCPHCNTPLLETATACFKCSEIVAPKPSSTATSARVHAFITGRLQPDPEGRKLIGPV